MAEKAYKLFIVGGKDRNVPPWIKAAFCVEQFDQDAGSRGRVPEPSTTPDAIIVMKSWIGHKHYYDARELATRLGVPMIEAAGGWSAAVQAAAEADLDWFLKAIEKTKDSEEVKTSKEEPVEEVIDNAWRQAYESEWTKRTALEKRYAKDRKKFEEADARLGAVAGREAAAHRVIEEVRAAAKAQRERLEAATEEVRRLAEENRQRSDRITLALANHLIGIERLIDRVSAGEQVLLQGAKLLADTKQGLIHNLRELNVALGTVERAPQNIETPSVAVATTSASNSASQKEAAM